MMVSLMELDALVDEHLTNLPDHRFVSHCLERYGLNKGVYNTIDDWMYRKGMISITERREVMIIFLASLQEERGSSGPLRWGKGVLTKRLLEFTEQYKL
ncbi:RNA-binding riboflavin kinase RibR [Paenibacillus solanacearum]|uniref:RNA-binding riboflavin kinase RibR n=1 Tax=Paenibacillus solanacearum TaxID=2048548 RepID=A0A916NXZ5_9BACL|nr:RNA-binding protein [Paenibacillus solanacearum]CAG7636323.1 RNA-binding riboflavin kinase RibR [Paenibacillus solanacearum]